MNHYYILSGAILIIFLWLTITAAISVDMRKLKPLKGLQYTAEVLVAIAIAYSLLAIVFDI